MKIVCINASNKPGKIPNEDWPKKNRLYHATKFVKMGIQKNKTGVTLKEISLKANSFPYELYDLERFVPLDKFTGELEEHVEEELKLTV
jgi:hypothetical protein